MTTLRTLRTLTLIGLAVLVPAAPRLGLASDHAQPAQPADARAPEVAVRYRTLDRVLRERAADAQTKQRRAILAALVSTPTTTTTR
jgi:hypothetical protein